MQLDSVVLPSSLDIWFSSHPCSQVTEVLPAFQSRNVHGQAGTTSHSVQVDLGYFGVHMFILWVFVVVFCWFVFFSYVVFMEISKLLYISN